MFSQLRLHWSHQNIKNVYFYIDVCIRTWLECVPRCTRKPNSWGSSVKSGSFRKWLGHKDSALINGLMLFPQAWLLILAVESWQKDGGLNWFPILLFPGHVMKESLHYIRPHCELTGGSSSNMALWFWTSSLQTQTIIFCLSIIQSMEL